MIGTGVEDTKPLPTRRDAEAEADTNTEAEVEALKGSEHIIKAFLKSTHTQLPIN